MCSSDLITPAGAHRRTAGVIRTIIAALIGRAIDRRDGDGGAKGAIAGIVASSVLRRLGPLGWVIGALWMAGGFLFGRRRCRY